jgi:membrane-associated phospholipid phosphatase
MKNLSLVILFKILFFHPCFPQDFYSDIQQRKAFNNKILEQYNLSDQFSFIRKNRVEEEWNFPYKLNWKKELAIGLGGITMAAVPYAVGPLNKLSANEVALLNPQDVNPFDRIAIYQRDETSDHASDVIQAAFVASSVISTGVFSKFKWKEWGTLVAMYAETFVWNLGITYSLKNYTSRPRPYVYRSDFLINNGGNMGTSDFQSHISGHTSTAFMCAVFISKTYSDIFPKSKGKWAVWTISLSLATLAGALRVSSGSHYPTDVIHGAFWGSVVGYFIPVLHKKPMFLGKKKKAQLKLSPFGLNDFYGLSANIRF